MLQPTPVSPTVNSRDCTLSSLIDYLLECACSVYIMFTEWSCLRDLCQRAHYDVFLILNNGFIYKIVWIECTLHICYTDAN